MTDYSSTRMNLNGFAWALAGAILVAAPAFALPPSSAPASADSAQSRDDAAFGADAPIADERASYSYLRTLEGSATVASAGKGIGEALEANQPLLTGDLVRVDSDSRLELGLSDRNRLFLAADTSLILERLAFSGDREERITVLRLESGELILEVSEEALGDELPRIITANTTIYVQEPGQYRIETGVGSDGAGWTRILARRGYAEIVTDRGSSIVRAEEAVVALGDRETNLELQAADDADDLERWSDALAGRAARAARSASYVEPQLAYDAAPLEESGDWIEVENVNYWRPYVSAGWRPYWQGRWDWTPSGYTWVSYEPWGWVPYHYGRWCSLPGYGWAWRPGAVYSPAWVYWNWTSGYAGWVPMGYYSHFYNPWYNSGFRYGVYGWAGGGWGIYSDWNFAPVHCFRDRRFRGHMRRGREMEHESRRPGPPRGLLTTDTRDFRPDRIDRTEDLLHEIGKRRNPKQGGELPDMTDFVGRKGKLPTDVARIVLPPAGKDRAVIRDIDKAPQVVQAPVWRQREVSKEDKTDRSAARSGDSGDKESQVSRTDGGSKENPGKTTGLVLDKPRAAAPGGVSRGTAQSGSRGSVATQAPTGASTGGGATSSKGGTPGSTGTGRSDGSGAVRGNGKGEETTRGGEPDQVTGRPGAPRVVTRVPVARVREPIQPSAPSEGATGTSPATPGRQLWKERGGESTPVQRVVGSVRRPTPEVDSGASTSPRTSGAVGAPRPGGASRGTMPDREGNASTGPRPGVVEPKYPLTPSAGQGRAGSSGTTSQGGRTTRTAEPPVYGGDGGLSPRSSAGSGAQGKATQRAPAAERQAPATRQAPPPRSPSYPPAAQSRPSQPSRQPVAPPPTVRSRPSQPPAQPVVRSQPAGRSQPSQPVARTQPSGRSSSGSQPAAKSPSSGSKGGQRSSQSPPPPPEKKGDGSRR